MELVPEQNCVARSFSVWSSLMLLGLVCAGGCEEQPVPMMDADTPFSTILAHGTDREICLLTYYKLSNVRESRTPEDDGAEVPAEEQLLVTMWQMTEEIKNTGFRGALMLELEGEIDLESARRNYELVGLNECADLLGEIQVLVPEELPDSPEERWRAVNEIGKDKFMPFDERYREILRSGRLEKAMAGYIRKNSSTLSYLK